MILVLEINGGLLYLYSSASEAVSKLEAIDVGNGEYEFCDDTGQRFIGEVIAPATIFGAGNFRLKPEGQPDRSLVANFISRTYLLDQTCGDIKSLDDLRSRYIS